MSGWSNRASLHAAGIAALLLMGGVALGIVVDRVWLLPPPTHETPLTAEALSAHLGLSPAEQERVRVLLDSLHTEINGVVERSPDSLSVAVRGAQGRLEQALPADARAEFRAWMQEHHEQLIGRMHRRPGRHGITPAGPP